MKKLLSLFISIVVLLSFVTSNYAIKSVALTSIKLDKTNISLQEGKIYSLKVTLLPSNTTQKLIKFETSNKNVAIVDANGKITAKKAGKAFITAKSVTNTKISVKCNVTVQAGLDTSVYKFRIFSQVGLSGAEKPDFKEGFDKLLDTIEKANNVKITFDRIPAANYKERLMLAVAGGDYPELILFDSHADPVFLDGVKNNVFVPLTSYINTSANIKEFTYPSAFKVVTFNNDIYMIPRTSIARADGFLMRKDWLDNINFSVPADGLLTLDQFTEILKGFTKNDPDKNGKNDTYGITGGPVNDNMVPVISSYFNLLGWQQSGGKYKYISPEFDTQKDNFKKALEYTAMLWKNGYMDPDWPVNKGTSFLDKYYRGNAGMYLGGFAGHITARQNEINKLNPNGKLIYIKGVKDSSGKFNGATSSPGIYGGSAITRKAKKPERIVKVLDWILSDEGWNRTLYGFEGINYNVVDGDKILTEKPLVGTSLGGMFVRRNSDPDYFIDLRLTSAEKNAIRSNIKFAMNSVVFSKDMGYRPDVAVTPQYIEVENKRLQMITKIILGKEPVSSYDVALADWYKNGGEEYVKQMNAYIQNQH